MDDAADTATPRSRLIVAAVLGAVLLVVLAVVLISSRGDDDESAGSTTTAATTDEDGPSEDSSDDGAPDDPTTDGSEPVEGPDATVATVVPVDPIQGSTEAELCAAIVERLEQYRDAAREQLPDDVMIASIDEFEAQVDTLSDDQDWGDRIIEQLTNVRREWATARSAAQADEPEEAEARNEAAIGHLDQAIETADCPTA